MSSRTSHTMNVQLTSKNVLTLDELELYELCQLAGVLMEPATFKIILDLLKMNVSPQAVLQMLKTMCAGRKKHQAQSRDHASHHETENMPPPRQHAAPKIRRPSGSTGSSSRRTDTKR
ncbi:mitotic-spindle organizing protein 2-like [Mercenaria mercenaria]|uniref:mitotic-spindle organizing protein 2-like n=1 Tax=Mercenaria mercenaria TaxID=6596 RepID=UPI001E1D6416|nr:mitotic-spindle organizing protein 2-like [Mercenaria mercenaria]XP_045172530.1 mitotic-spindle organizing protein 2-like [Mercenaria mercenaria]